MLPEEDLDGELGHYLKRIEEGDVSALVDAKIEPSKDLNRNKEMFITFTVLYHEQRLLSNLEMVLTRFREKS